MKEFFLIVLLYVISLCAEAQTLSFDVKVSNTWTCSFKDEGVVIDLHKIKDLKWCVKKAIVTCDNSEIACQLDDFDGDMRPDELAFLSDLKPKETKAYCIKLYATGTQKQYESRVYAHMSISSKSNTEISAIEALGASNVFNNLYHHGAAFESELAGFRIYSDARQNVDIYGKRKYRLELAKTMFNTTASQISQGFGNDVLWNGGSIACGTLREWNHGVTTFTDVRRRGQRIIAYGPVRTIVEVTDYAWHDSLNLKTLYTLYAGHRDVKVNVIFNKPEAAKRLCTGVQKIGAKPFGGKKDDGLVVSWGKDYPDYGKKDIYERQSVGIAVYVPPVYISEIVEDSINYIIVLQSKEYSLHYWLTFCADMEEQGPAHSAKEWITYTRNWQESLQRRLLIELC